MKICRDCASGLFYVSFATRVQPSPMCMRPIENTRRIDPVAGEVVEKAHTPCSRERRLPGFLARLFGLNDADRCGPDAIYFKPRPQSSPPGGDGT